MIGRDFFFAGTPLIAGTSLPETPDVVGLVSICCSAIR
jgi:hypothetical protein